MAESSENTSGRPSSYFDEAVIRMINFELNKQAPDIVGHLIEERNRHAPEWFKTEMEEIKLQIGSKFESLESKVTSLESKVTSLESKVTSLESKVTSLESKVTSLESKVTSLESELKELKTFITRKFVAIDSRFNILEYKLAFSYNASRRSHGYEAQSVPFLNTDEIQEELPSIMSVEDIDSLTKHECQMYLRAYNVLFHSNETVKLKERLRDAIGLIVSYDLKYQFAGFSST